MKQHLKKAWLCLSSLLCIYSSSYGQTQYLKANSVANFWLSTVETSNSCQDTKSAFSTVDSQDIVLFNNPNQECSNKTNVSLRLVNLNLDKWIRVTCMTFSEQTVCQFNLAPGTYANQTVILPYNTNYMWKVEDSTPQTPTFGKDTLRIEASRFVQNVNITDNNLNMPSPNITYNIKAGQTINLVSLLGSGSPLSITAGSSLGTQNIVFEVFDNNLKIGEDVLTVIVGPTCTINVESFEAIAFGSTTYNVTVRSNIPAKPYVWELRDAFGTGILRKTGTTSTNTTGVVEQISLETIGTGTYNLFFRSANNQYCSGLRRVALLDDRDKCTVTILNPKVLAGLFTATISVSANLSGMAWSLQTVKDSIVATATSFNPSINLRTLPAGDYILYARPNNFCSANYRFTWTGSVDVNQTRGYLKKYNNVPDYYEMAGIGDYAGVKDAGTGWVVKENRNVMLWQTYVKALSNSPGAKALITFRQDSSSTSKHFSLAFEKGKIKVIQRSLKGGANVVSTEITTTSESTWLRFERNGNNLLCKASDSPPESDNPVFATIATINNAFIGWTLPFWKGLYISSGSSTTLASAEFHRFLGGPYTGTTAVADNTPLAPPIIAASNLNPTANASVTFTSSACKSGYLIQYYKNGLPSFQGATYVVNAIFGDSYKAKCEKGSDKSAFSNTIPFNAPAPGPTETPAICGITDGLKIGDKTQFGSVFEMKARIFNGKLWLTQSLGTNPESFLVRGVNMLVGDFVKTWTGNDYSCFEGQTTNPGGFPEPSGFTTPAGYSLTTTNDGARIYKLGTGSGVDPPTLVSSPVVPTTSSSVTFTVSNCVGTVTFFKNGINSGTTTPLLIATPVLNDVYSAKCTVGSATSGFSNSITITSPAPDGGGGNGTVGVLADLDIPAETMWNRFQPNLIPDFVPTKSVDPKTGQNLPNKWFIWHAPYRNLFGDTEYSRLLNMTKKGVTAWNISKLPNPPYDTQMQSLITPERVVGENYGLGENQGNPHPEEQNWTNWIKWAKDGVSNAASYGVNLVGGKYNQLLTISDYENLHTNLTNQTASNYHTVALNSMADIAVGCVGFQYGAAINTLGYYTSNLYTGSNNVWALPADSNVPSQFVGKSSASNNRIVGVNEITYALEAILPEDFQVKDQNNQNWFTIKHFGAELDNTYNGGNLNGCNAQHWATNVGVGVETMVNAHRSYPNGGQYVIAQLKNGNETDNGFHYDQRFAQFRNNKYANYVNRYGITNIRDVYTNGVKTGTEEYLQPMGSEYITNFMAEGQVFTAYFCGAKGINLWNSDFTDVAVPKTKEGNVRRGAKHNDVNYGNRDLESYTYTLKALWRLNQKILLSNGQSYSFNEICDGSEVYLNQATKVVYPGSSSVTQLRALDWQILKRTPVRAVVNVAKNVVFVLAFQAYGVEQSQVTYKLTDYGANISEVIDVPAGKIIVRAYPLVGGLSQGGTIVTPVISSNPTSPVAGTAVTFSTSSVCTGTIKWFSGDAQVSIGTSYTVANPVANNTYFANCTVAGVSSGSSNVITIGANTPPSGGITITEPAKPQYYFSNGHAPSYYDNNINMPAIHQSGTRNVTNYSGKILSGITMQANYSPTNDLVWLSNDKIKVGLNLLRGGQIAWLSTVNATTNLVYNGYDGGFQITMDAYQRKDGYTQGGKFSRKSYNQTLQYDGVTNNPDNPLTSYNTTMGGDFNNNSQSLIAYYPITNGYVVKYRPIFYTLDCEFSEITIEAKYTLQPGASSVRVEYTYHSFRSDSQFNGGGFDGTAAPSCFFVNTLNKYQVYTGNSPWTNGAVEDGQLPIENYGQALVARNATEKYSCVYNPTTLKTAGVYIPSSNQSEYTRLKQLEVYNGNPPGTEFGGGFTHLDFNHDFGSIITPIPDRSNYTKTIVGYVIATDSPEAARAEAYRLKTLLGN